MASHLSVSLSDSIQASLIIQHQEQRRQRQSTNTTGRQTSQDDTGDRDGDPTKRLSLWVQCLLVMVFAGIEISVTFTIIYNILFLQFVGVPTSMLSLGGVICGAFNIVALPFIGWFSERSPNPVKRKMKLMTISLSAYILGYVSLASCSVYKFYSFQNPVYQENITTTEKGIAHNYSHMSYHAMGNHPSMLVVNSSLLNNQRNLDFILHPHDTVQNTETNNSMSDLNDQTTSNLIGYISLVSFGIIDIGFDSGMSICRAFILECAPPSIHIRLLFMASLFSSIGGVAFSVVGTIDFPGILGPMFNADGTAVTVFMFSCCILTFEIFAFACTITTGYFVSRKYSEDSHIDLSKEQDKSKQSTNAVYRATATEPLLSKNNFGKKSYSALSTTVVNENTGEQNVLFSGLTKVIRFLSTEEDNYDGHYNNNSDIFEMKSRNEDTDDEGQDDSEDESICSGKEEKLKKNVNEEDKDDHNDDDDDDDNDGNNDDDDEDDDDYSDDDEQYQNRISTIWSAFGASYSGSLSVLHDSLLGNFKNRYYANKELKGVKTQSNYGPKIWKNKRLMVLCVSIFFTGGSMLLFSIYNSNVLTIGIYHGDPTAAPGTDGRSLYEKGLRSSALGNLVMYLAYALVSLLNKKIIDIVGEKVQFVLCQMLLIVVLVAFLVVESEELYYVSTIAAGFFRACTFTLGYLLANKFVHEEQAGSGDPKATAKNVGQVMVLIGFLLPSQYLLMSSIVGPLLNATGNVWVTMIMAIVYTAISVSSFSLLFIIKS